METMKPSNTSGSLRFNRLLYGLFIVLALYQSLYSRVYIDAASSLAIALILDPFNQEQPWNERPNWQKIWLFVHLGLAAAMLGFGIALD